jgi:urease gamma subunit
MQTFTCLGRAQFDLVMNWLFHTKEDADVTLRCQDGAVLVTVHKPA